MAMPFRIGPPPAGSFQGAPLPPQLPSYVQLRGNINLRPRGPPVRLSSIPQAAQLPEQHLLFVGNIDERVPNDLLHALFSCCGPLEKWQRLEGPDGRLPAFGYVGFQDPESAIMAIKAMHNFRIGNKHLNVKPDERVRQILFEHVRRERALINLPRKQIGTELEVEEHEVEKVEEVKESVRELLRETHAHLLVEEIERTNEDGEVSDGDARRSRSPRGRLDKSRRRGRKTSRDRRSPLRSDNADGRKKWAALSRCKFSRKRRRSSSSTSSKGSAARRDRSNSLGNESEASDVVQERKSRKREQRRREEEYLRQLKKFEERERRMAKQYSREDEEDLAKSKVVQKEAKKLAQFLEDYNDERDDPKYYKNSAYVKRRADYDQERERDRLDRETEAKEFAALKELIMAEGKAASADSEARRRHEQALKELNERAARKKQEEDDADFRYSFVEEAGDGAGKEAKTDGTVASTSTNPKVVTSLHQKVISQVNSVFGEEEDDEHTHVIKKKIKMIEITEQDRIESMTDEERKQMVADLIKEIPTSKTDLFEYPLNWDLVTDDFIAKRVSPWVQKKIREYIGGDEPALVKFICENVQKRCEANKLLSDLAMILDDEADPFIVKLWRLLIFQTKALSIGLNVGPAKT